MRRLVISGANARGDFDGLAYLRFRFSSDQYFAASMGPRNRERYSRVSPDGAKHWATILAKTKALWATRVVIAHEDLAAIQIPVLVMSGDHDVIRSSRRSRSTARCGTGSCAYFLRAATLPCRTVPRSSTV